MMTISSRAVATAFASLLLMGTAFAQTAAPAAKMEPAAKMAPAHKMAATDKMAPAKKKATKPRSEASLECSKEADTKGLHGKERKKFMSDCKKMAKNTAAKPAK
jgi:psiF repeat